jgi:hypothetical protein
MREIEPPFEIENGGVTILYHRFGLPHDAGGASEGISGACSPEYGLSGYRRIEVQSLAPGGVQRLNYRSVFRVVVYPLNI